MMNKIQEAIEKLEANPNRSDLEDKLLEMLQQKQAELGEDATEDEIEEGLRQVIKDHLMFALRHKMLGHGHSGDDDDDDDNDDDVDYAAHQENIRLVREVFQQMDLKFRDHSPIGRKSIRIFELGVDEDGKRLRMKVYLEASAKACRIDALYPFAADESIAYPLCEMLAKQNYPLRFGGLKYDARDGELSYSYSFPTANGLHRNDFERMFLTVIAAAYKQYDTVRTYANGRFRKDVRQQIVDKTQTLLNEIDF